MILVFPFKSWSSSCYLLICKYTPYLAPKTPFFLVAGTVSTNSSCCNGNSCCPSYALVCTWCSGSWTAIILWSRPSCYYPSPSNCVFPQLNSPFLCSTLVVRSHGKVLSEYFLLYFSAIFSACLLLVDFFFIYLCLSVRSEIIG